MNISSAERSARENKRREERKREKERQRAGVEGKDIFRGAFVIGELNH